MTALEFIAGHPWLSLALLYVAGGIPARIVRRWRERRPVRVRLVLTCPDCEREHAAHPFDEAPEVEP